MKKSKWISKLSALVLMVLMVLSTAVTAFASSSIPAAPNPADGPGSLTVHKYATFNASTVPGNGTELPAAEADKLGKPLAGVDFELYRIIEDWDEINNPTG